MAARRADADSFQFLALAVMALGLGGVLAALLGQVRGFAISPTSIALPVLAARRLRAA